MTRFETICGHTLYIPALKSDCVVVDLGANHGGFTRAMSSRFGGAYFLVEANPALALDLRARAGFPVWECAVADRDAAIDFHVAHNDEGSSILELPAASVYNCTLRETIAVRARTLKSLLDEMNIPRIDLVKMDIEGAEVAVLRSVPDADLKRMGQIAVEFHCDPSFGFGMRREVEDVVLRLQRLGFLCLDFSGGSRCDVLFLNRRLHRIPWLRGRLWESMNTPAPGGPRIWKALPRSWRRNAAPRSRPHPRWWPR